MKNLFGFVFKQDGVFLFDFFSDIFVDQAGSHVRVIKLIHEATRPVATEECVGYQTSKGEAFDTLLGPVHRELVAG